MCAVSGIEKEKKETEGFREMLGAFCRNGPDKRGQGGIRCTSFGKAFRKGCDAICENGSDPSLWSIKVGLL